jgi:serine protease inhibitor
MRRKFLAAIGLCMSLLLALSGCGAATGDLMANVHAAEKPAAPSEPDSTIIASIGQFSWKLLQESAKNEGNILVSPASVFIALAMTLNGADTTTRTAMLEALSASGLTVDQINAACRDWMSLLMNTNGKTKLSIANSIWYRDGFDADPAFLQRNADFFSAAAKTLDFSQPGAVSTINGWVKNATNGTIDKIVEQIDPDVVMYLINAVYFKAEWKTKFDKAYTYERIFSQPDGDVKVKFLTQTGPMSYMKNDDSQGVLLPYSDGRYAFVALLPDSGLSPRDLVASMDADALASLLASRQDTSVELSMPKFETRYEDSLVNELTALGMGESFAADVADFSLMNAGRRKDLYISEVKHKTFCRVDEDGTEASAVTSVEIRETSLPVGDVQLIFNRPFIYGIVDTTTGLPLFLGILEDPAA